MVVLLLRSVGLLLDPLMPSLSSLDLISWLANSLTRTRESFCNSLIASRIPYRLSKPHRSSHASQMVESIRSRLTRTAGFVWLSFCPTRSNISGRASVVAIAGLRRNSFWRGSRRFSNAFAFDIVMHRIIATVKETSPLRLSNRCSSTLAVSS